MNGSLKPRRLKFKNIPFPLIKICSAVIAGMLAAHLYSDTTVPLKAQEKPSEKKEETEKKTRQPKPDRGKKFLKKLGTREWYRQKEIQKKQRVERYQTQDDADLTALKKSAHEEIGSIIVLLGEIPVGEGKPLYAPVFLMDKKNIFGTRSNFSLKWVGYKVVAGLKQNNFPWKGTSLSETFIGSFLYASGTNIGFYGDQVKEERRFYTNYTSELVSLRIKAPWRTSIAFTLDSRQYFFIKRNTPDNFVMPRDHVNVFPRLDLNLEQLTEKGIDQLTQGIGIELWAGYGIRNRWDDWGERPDLENGSRARTFGIYSGSLTAGALIAKHHNLVLRVRYKGGFDNDFLTRPRFGGTIDNAKLDVVHGFPIDHFRVNAFGLANLRYGFNLFSRLRFNIFGDYAHIFETALDDTTDAVGAAYGFRLLAWGGLPVWITHGMGKKIAPRDCDLEHMIMIMTAAGW